MVKLLVTLVFAMLASIVSAQEHMLMRIGTLSIDFPVSWHFQGSGQRGEGRGPNGEEVIANYRVLRPGAPPEVTEQHWNTIRGFVKDKMPELAEKNGAVVRHVTESPLQDGRVQFSSISQGKRRGQDYYFVQYLLGSPRLMAYITVEGVGDGVQAAERFEKILATQRWSE
jgi:hypothetical protein